MIILSPFILWILVSLLIIFHDLIFSHWPVPDYQKKKEVIDLSDICQKIQNSSLKKMCISKLEDPDFKISIEIRSGKYLCRYADQDEFKNIFLAAKTKNDPTLCENLAINPAPEYSICCQALVENPYICNRIGFIGPIFFNEASKGECYEDAALIWKDPSLCKKTKNKDQCYLRLVIED